MNNSTFRFPPSAFGLAALLLAVAVVAPFVGCRPFDYYGQSLQAPVPPAMEPPREKSMVSLARLSRGAARHSADRDAEDGALAALPHRGLRRVADPRRRHDIGPAHRRFLPGGRRRHGEFRPGLRHGAHRRHDHRRGHRGHYQAIAADPAPAGGIGAVGCERPAHSL